MTTLSINAKVRRMEHHKWRETQDGRLMLFPRQQTRTADFHGFYEFGEFESMVWRTLDSPMSVNELQASLKSALEEMEDVEVPSPEELLGELCAFLCDLQENGLVVLSEE